MAPHQEELVKTMKPNPLVTDALRTSIESNYVPQGLDPRVNAYACPDCGGRVLTVDCADGTTPMSLPCFTAEGRKSNIIMMGGAPAKPQCQGTMVSQWYSLAPESYVLAGVKYEWRLPSIERYMEMKKKEPALAHHVLHGGLILHNRTDAAVLTHGGAFVLDGRVLEGEELGKVLGPFALLRDMVEIELASQKEIQRKAAHGEVMRKARERKARQKERREKKANRRRSK